MNTTQQTESFIWVENPPLTTTCGVCGKSVKHSIDDADAPVFLNFPYRKITIKIFEGGRTFEKVSTEFVHACSQPVAAPPNGLGCFPLGELALL